MREQDLIGEMNRYYDARAPLHDELMSYAGSDAMEERLAPLIALFEEDVRGRDVLEVACGTGNWTQVLARRARSVVATDVNESVLDIARAKRYEGAAVRFEVADAYALEGVGGPFDAAFAADWWSHIPKGAIPAFLSALHGSLRRGARVVMIDMLPHEGLRLGTPRYDAAGNLIHRRALPDGREYDVVKNFPTAEELRGTLDPVAGEIAYREEPDALRWLLAYTLR